MAPHDDEDDPAVYRSGPRKKTDSGNNVRVDAPSGSQASIRDTLRPPSSSAKGDIDEEDDDENDGEDGDEEDDNEDEDEDDSVLLMGMPLFNRLTIVLRDQGVMRFIKYISAEAEGSRWDVCGEYEIGMLVEEEEEANEK
jgi:prolyl 3-hydroxylase /prolyl 3,4-dihydroxylase